MYLLQHVFTSSSGLYCESSQRNTSLFFCIHIFVMKFGSFVYVKARRYPATVQCVRRRQRIENQWNFKILPNDSRGNGYYPQSYHSFTLQSRFLHISWCVINNKITKKYLIKTYSSLGLPAIVQRAALNIGSKAEELDIVPGCSAVSVAAAAIYMASNASDKKLTKKEVCDVTCGVKEFTIGKSYELMYPRAAELFPVDFELDINKLPKSWSTKRFFLFLVIATTELLEIGLSIFLTSLEELKCDSHHCGP